MSGEIIAIADLALLALAPIVGLAIYRFARGYGDAKALAEELGEINAAAPHPLAESPLPPIGLALVVVAWTLATRAGIGVWAGVGLGWTLLALALVDLRWRLLPNRLTLPLAAAGLALAAWREAGVPLRELAGLAIGFASFAVIGALYRSWRGRDGLGLGDAKLLAAAGAWLGWAHLPAVVFLACVAALTSVGVLALLGRRIERGDELAFGPYLCAAFWLVWLYAPLRIH